MPACSAAASATLLNVASRPTTTPVREPSQSKDPCMVGVSIKISRE
ncbi:Uncharacterised protein [Bordetella pertussis]|nr:Uncharacterised protein [Bordetella pertussis]